MRRSVSLGLGSVILGSLVFIACGGGGDGGDRPDDEQGGGTSGTGTGGTSTGGTMTGGTAGSGPTGGAAGSGGTSGSASCIPPDDPDMCPMPCTPAACTPMAPPQALLTDFTNLLNGNIFNANDATGMPKPEWWLGFYGGTYAYPMVPGACTEDQTQPTYPITTDPCNGDWRISGTVGTYSGFGLWFQSCMIDMSDYSGISFNMGGDAGPTGMLKFSISTNATTAPDMCRTNQGTCMADCVTPSTMVTVPATQEVVTINFADLTGGVPEATVDTAEVVGMQFEFDCVDCTATPYEVNLTIDDVTLVP